MSQKNWILKHKPSHGTLCHKRTEYWNTNTVTEPYVTEELNPETLTQSRNFVTEELNPETLTKSRNFMSQKNWTLKH